jgi:2-polyprenyl-3-methyl-5-hydroxy-6-metoxy-1,4-benzoquinol methylase
MTEPRIKQVEQATLRTFQEEIPSLYFSDKTEAEFKLYSENAESTYRDLFKFPPKMFDGVSLIDFGAGTGENTVSLARWGANCTLVEMNHKAIAIARQVFDKYAGGGSHTFIQSSIFDFESPQTFDIVHCRGVLSHTADKEGAFNKIAGYLKPGGFLIFGDPNKAGGFQNMLQRFAVYRNGKTWDEMVDVCERLFKEDIDRSQSFVNRSRRAIIFDRWVIQSQDDPSLPEVLSWMDKAGLELYSCFPPFLPPLLGDSVHHKPRFNVHDYPAIGCVAETVWLLQNQGDNENVGAFAQDCAPYAARLAELTGYVANFNSSSSLDADKFDGMAQGAVSAFAELQMLGPLQTRFSTFMSEAREFVRLVAGDASVDDLRAYVESCQLLFSGAVGVRHVDFIAYKRG